MHGKSLPNQPSPTQTNSLSPSGHLDFWVLCRFNISCWPVAEVLKISATKVRVYHVIGHLNQRPRHYLVHADHPTKGSEKVRSSVANIAFRFFDLAGSVQGELPKKVRNKFGFGQKFGGEKRNLLGDLWLTAANFGGLFLLIIRWS